MSRLGPVAPFYSSTAYGAIWTLISTLKLVALVATEEELEWGGERFGFLDGHQSYPAWFSKMIGFGSRRVEG